MSRIPLELVYEIFNHLEPRRYDTLCACALVSRVWLSQAHLFADVCLRPNPWRNLHGFLQLLRSNPNISHVVKSLTVNCATIYKSTPPYLVIIEALEMLPNLQKLSLADMVLPQTFPDLLRGCRSFTLRELHVTTMKTTSVPKHAAAAFFDFLALFAHVERLHLGVYLVGSLEGSPNDDLLASSRPPPLSLTSPSLRLDGFELDQSLLARFLGSGPLSNTVKTLTMTAPALLYLAPCFASLFSQAPFAIESLLFNVSRFSGARDPLLRDAESEWDGLTKHLGPVMRKMLSLRSIHILYPRLGRQNTSGSTELFAVIECMPPSVTELHLYSKRGALPLPPATLEQVPGKCGPLRSVYLYTPYIDDAVASLREHPGIRCVQWTRGREYDY